MLNIKDHKTINMFDPFDFLGPKRRKMLGESWAGIFRDHVRHVLPVDLLARYFSAKMGRPTNELVAMMGAMLLQQMHNLTDQETAEQFVFNIQWHYALDITNNSGRICIFTEAIKRFLVNLKRQHKNDFNELDLTLRDRYLKKEEESAFSMVKPSESTKTLQMVAEDLFFLINRFCSRPDIASMKTYQLMTRVLKEQCITEQGENTDEPRVILKANKDIPSDSLQNPSDPDAGYSGHKGKGYQAQVAETYSNEKDAGTLSLITYVDVQAAHESDAVS
ncbi:MAG: transposase [Candidatus Electrothrix sp. GW3-4]|uniref:transposase n=1 Tax=Candidatus Electrothrix sp. GW3-4 TaxID=3126740 RepID=UPI0030CAD698